MRCAASRRASWCPPRRRPARARASPRLTAARRRSRAARGCAGRSLGVQASVRRMFGSIVVGTDGSETASEAVRAAVDLAKSVGAKIQLVSAYEPVSNQRIREEQQQAPDDVAWSINPREDVDANLSDAAEMAEGAGVDVERYARQGDPADA